MKNMTRIFAIAAAAAVGLSTAGCATRTEMGRELGWAYHTAIPSKDYVVIGAVLVRDVTERSVIAALMQAAIDMGGHDIINVRITQTRTRPIGGSQIDSASAVVIRFTDETLVTTTTATVTHADGSSSTTSSSAFWTGPGRQ